MAPVVNSRSANIGYALGRFTRSHPIGTLAIFIAAGILVYSAFSNLPSSEVRQAKPAAATTNTPSSSTAESSSGTTTDMQKKGSAKFPNAVQKQAQTVSPEQRQEIAGILEKAFRKEDLEISIHAIGDGNDTLVLSSDLFKDSASRAGVMRQLRDNWQDLLCKEGFKTVFLTEPGIFSGYRFRSAMPSDSARPSGFGREESKFGCELTI
jgi:hypothetical protein